LEDFAAVLNWRLFVPESWDDTCVAGPDGKPANAHARRLRQQPVTRDQAGAKKPHTRVQVPLAEQIRRRRAASKVPDTESWQPRRPRPLNPATRNRSRSPTPESASTPYRSTRSRLAA
jgi:hypothetical protein